MFLGVAMVRDGEDFARQVIARRAANMKEDISGQEERFLLRSLLLMLL
jgi:hypothetical protein